MCDILILAITSVLRKVKERKVKRMLSVYKSDSLTNGGIKKNKRKEEENDSFKDRKKFKEERYILDERLCGISCVGILCFLRTLLKFFL